jgi:hypothetical protein
MWNDFERRREEYDRHFEEQSKKVWRLIIVVGTCIVVILGVVVWAIVELVLHYT